jgi:membrane-associated phospholipid phosphatase
VTRVREATEVRRSAHPQPVRPAGWWFDAALLGGFVAITAALAYGYLLGMDLAVREWSDAHRPTAVYWTARLLNYLGQGGWLLTPAATALAALVAFRARSVRPLLLVPAAFVLIYVAIGPLKLWTDRAAPTSTLPPDESVRVFNSLPPGEYDLSYPSGHVVNAIVWYGVLAVLLTALTAGRLDPRLVRLVRVAPPAIVLATTTYLNFHWLTDGVAAILLGLVLDRLLARVPWDDLPLPRRLARWAGPALSRGGTYAASP